MRIGHFEQNIHGHGGIGSYIQRISGKQRLQGDQVFLYHRADTAVEDGTPIEHVKAYSDLAELARRDKLDILHVHTTTPYIGDMTAPMIRTIHTHQPYCPSGSRYFKNSDRACTRAFSISGCTLHALTEHCCSVRPAKLREAFQTTAWDQESLGHFAAIAISGYVREQMIRSGYATEGIHVLHNPAPDPVPITPIPAGVPRFVSIGRLEPLKGLQTLLRAFSLVRVPAHLDIAGDGTQFEQLRKLALTLGLADSVTFHGWLDPEGVNDLIDKSRAVVFPSTWPEPAGLVSLEAQTRGRPVIASRVGGIPEYVQDESTAILVPPSDPSTLAAAITRLATDRCHAAILGQNGRQYAGEHFSLDDHILRLAALYDGAIRHHRESAKA